MARVAVGIFRAGTICQNRDTPNSVSQAVHEEVNTVVLSWFSVIDWISKIEPDPIDPASIRNDRSDWIRGD